MNWRQNFALAFSFCFFLMLFFPQKASCQAITTNPNPVAFGTGCLYAISPPITNAQSYNWQYKYTSPVATALGSVSSTPNAATQSVIEAIPGTFYVQCTIKLQPTQQNPNPQPMILSKTVVVPKPDGYTITGTGVPTALGAPCKVVFQITQGGNPVKYINGFAQESITNFFLWNQFGTKTQKPDSGWVPADANAPGANMFVIS